ncbi:MAG: type VI secretion system baseplate subunit TssG [bacterium]
MVSQNRGSSSDLKLSLLQEGHKFSFFQVIRLLRLLEGEPGQRISRKSMEKERIRVRPDLSLGFPAADIAGIEELPNGESSLLLVTATFLGLYGTSSPLPTFYTEDLMSEAAADESVTRDFLDIINDRLFSLLFHCLAKYRQFFQVVEENNVEHLERLFCLLGLGEKNLWANLPWSYGLLRYLGLFTQYPRSSLGLQTMLQDALGEVPVELIPCLKRKAKIPQDQRLRLGLSGGCLGQDGFLGEEIEDRMGKFGLQIGPLDPERFHALLPGGENHQKLTFLIGLYLVEPFEYDLELILDKKKGQMSTTCLGGPQWAGLGLDTWIFSGDYEGEIRAYFQYQNELHT